MKAYSIEAHHMIGFRGLNSINISSWHEIVIEKVENGYPELVAMEDNYVFIVYSNSEIDNEKINQYVEED